MSNKTFLGIAALLIVVILYSSRSSNSPFKNFPNPTPTTQETGCTRTQEYSINEEFKRAISLVIQRLQESNNSTANDLASIIRDIRNCVIVQYAPSEESLNQAEGVFSFSRDSSPNRLEILVSPKYKIKDDLLTAALLSHELTHAAIFVNDTDGTISCYQNEAYAFTSQIAFVASLNQEEMASLTFRYNQGYPEVRNLFNLARGIMNSEGVGDEKALNYVRSQRVYQQQCGQ